MENSIKIKLVEALKQHMELHKLSQADISKKSGVRKEYVNIILKENSDFMYDAGGKQGLIPVKHFNAIADLIGFSTQKSYWQSQPTAQFLTMLATLEDAKSFGTTAVIIGETGSGKTYTKNIFCNKHQHDVFSITVGSSDNLGDLIDKIIDELKITTGKTKSKKIRDIAKKLKDLKDEGFKPMVIFDESEYMKQPALCAMKELYDNLQNYCSIVMIGTDQLVQNLDKLRKRNKAGIPQFYRRIKFGIRIMPTIDRTYSLFIKDLDKGLQKFLLRNCDNYGELHDALVPTMREADRMNAPLNEQLIRQVLNIQEGVHL